MKYFTLLLAFLTIPVFAAQVKVGEAPSRDFPCHGTDGVAVDADELPTGYVTAAGSSVASLTITDVGTGQYRAVYTVPASSDGVLLTLWVSLVVDGVTYLEWLDCDQVVGKRVNDLNDLAAGAEMDLIDAPNGTAVTAIQTGLSTFDGTGATLHTDYDAAKTAAQAGDAMTLTEAYDAAKTAAPTGETATVIGAAGANLTAVQISGTKKTLDVLHDATQLVQRSEPPTVVQIRTEMETAVGAVLPQILADTDDIGAAGAGLTALGDTRLGNLDAAVSSRAPAATALSSAVWTNTKAGYLDQAVSGVPAAVWAVSTRTLSSFGTLVSDAATATYNAIVAVWTPTKAGYLDAAMSSRAPAATALSSAVWTNTKAGYLDQAVSEAGGGDAPTVEEIDTELSTNHGAGLWGAATSETSVVVHYTVTHGGVPTPDALVSCYSDAACTQLLDSRRTNQNGVADFPLEPGSTVYMWPRKAGYSWNPDMEVVPL